jgi:hypothetical protein
VTGLISHQTAQTPIQSIKQQYKGLTTSRLPPYQTPESNSNNYTFTKTLKNIPMAAAPFLTDLPIEKSGRNGSHFDVPYIEPFLAKHSAWYRRHSKVQPVTEADLATEGESQRRSSSVASEETDSAAPAATASEPKQGLKHAEPLGKEEQKTRRSSVVKALRWAFWYNGNE